MYIGYGQYPHLSTSKHKAGDKMTKYRHKITGKVYQVESTDENHVLLLESKTGQDLLVTQREFLNDFTGAHHIPRIRNNSGGGMHMNGQQAATFRGYGVRCNFN